MRTVYEERIAEAREIEGRIMSGRDTVVPPSKFGAVCRVLWPEKTAAHLAAIGGKDERTAKRWLSTEYDPPVEVALAVFAEIFRRN